MCTDPSRGRSARLVLFVLFVLLGALFASCSIKNEIEPQWQRLEVDAPSDRILWKVANMSVNNRGYPRGELDLAEMEIESGWRNDLAPFRGEGYRTKAHLKMDPIEPGRWAVDARVEKEVNKALTRQLSLADADWEPVPDDVAGARVLLQHIRSLLPDDIEPHEPTDPIERLLERAEAMAQGDPDDEEDR